MAINKSKVIGLAVFMALVVPSLPVSAANYETDQCGPMCHLPLDVHGVNSGKHLGPMSGNFQDMKRHFNIGPNQAKAWDKFQKAIIERMVTAFNAETLTLDNITTRPDDFDGETYAPTMSVELIEKWNNVLKTYDDMKDVLEKDRVAVADRIRMICEQVK
jgi:hypothetical protein